MRSQNRVLSLALAACLVLSTAGGAATSTYAAAEPGRQSETQGSAPVQILGLTATDGKVTDIATGGLSGPKAQAVHEVQSPAPAATTKGNGLSPAAGARLRTVLSAHGGGHVDDVDPHADATLLTEPLEVDEFMVAGFAWDAGSTLPEHAHVFLRVREKGVWSQWSLNEVEAATGPDKAPSRGTGEVVTAGADGIQVSVVLDELAELSELPRGLHLVLVPAHPNGQKVRQAADLKPVEAAPTGVLDEEGSTEVDTPGVIISGPQAQDDEPEAGSGAHGASADGHTHGANGHTHGANGHSHGSNEHAHAPAGTSGGAVASQTGALLGRAAAATSGVPVPVSTRSEWGADERNMTWDPEYAQAGHVVVHHTAGSNSYTASQSASIVRGIYYYHAVTLGWGDIGYNFLVDKYGQVFEGRYGTLVSSPGKMVVGGHARGINTGSMGISMIGNYSEVEPPAVMLDKVSSLASWFLTRGGHTDLNASAPIHIGVTERYQKGQTVSLPRVLAHRDIGFTSCPGDAGYAKMGQIRQLAQQKAAPSGKWASQDGLWYYRDSAGNPVKGWLEDRGSWYYLDPQSGAMATGWKQVGQARYYLEPGSGAMATGWKQVGQARYYLEPGSGAMATGWKQVGGKWYYLDPQSGEVATGWKRLSESWYYLEPGSGAMATGWKQVGQARYYLEPGSGAMASGWKQLGGKWYYLNPQSGEVATGWKRLGESWYYLEPGSGAMASGWKQVGGKWYYLEPGSGAMASGWKQVGGKWYYLEPGSGAMATGWKQVGGKWYYLQPGSGAMVSSRTLVDGRWSDFASSGQWLGYSTVTVASRSAQIVNAGYMSATTAGRGAGTPIMAAPTNSREQLISTMVQAYNASGKTYPYAVLGAGGAPDPKSFFTIVYDEAVAEGVSPELLFAQVVKETGWLQFGGDVSAGQYNFGGLGATGGGAQGNGFPDVRTGLRAQVQHLRAYADPNVTVSRLAHPVVDTRFAYVRKGSAVYVEHLGIRENPSGAGWATARGYGTDLARIVRHYFG